MLYMNNNGFNLKIYFKYSRYDILNYVGREGGFRQAGNFRQTRIGTHILRMSKSPKMFFDKSSNLPESVCSKPCRIGQRVKNYILS